MLPAWNIVVTLLFIGAAQGVLLSLALATKREGPVAANRLLAALLTLFSFIISMHAIGIWTAQGMRKSGHDHFLLLAVFFLFGPLFYYYVKFMTVPQAHFKLPDVFHLLPFAVLIFLLLVLQNSIPLLFTLTPWLLTLHVILYLIVSIIMLQNHSKRIRNTYTNIEKIKLHWLRFFMAGLLVIWPVAFYSEFYGNGSDAWSPVWLLTALFMYAIGYYSLRQPVIFDKVAQIKPSDPTSKKYERSALSAEKATLFYEKLLSVMDREKLFLDAELSLPILADRLAISNHHLSQIINEKTQKNFFEFVNAYRVSEAKRLLADPQKTAFTIAAIGFDCGFNSISSFNSVFKQITGQTPSQFRKSHT